MLSSGDLNVRLEADAKAEAQRKGVDLLTASEVTIGHNADGTPIKAQVIRNTPGATGGKMPVPSKIPDDAQGSHASDSAHDTFNNPGPYFHEWLTKCGPRCRRVGCPKRSGSMRASAFWTRPKRPPQRV